MVIDQSSFQILQPAHNQISQEISRFLHDPMSTFNSMNLASFMLKKVVLPFTRTELEGFLLAVEKHYRD